MAKSGQARVLTLEQQRHLFDVIQEHRHPEKNTAIMRISFSLGLRVQEIALLQLKEVCTLGPSRKTIPRTFKVKEVMVLPASYTKGANAVRESTASYVPKRVSFDTAEFHRILKQVEVLAKADAEIDPATFYPEKQTRSGVTRDLPMVDPALRQSIEDYLHVRLANDFLVTKTDRLFITQKGGPYSPNTLQDHMHLMLTGWAGVEQASSHSGRRTLLTDIIHHQGKSVKVAQKIAGHKDAATTLGYEDPPEETIADALKNTRK